jgi:hypothetical protein
MKLFLLSLALGAPLAMPVSDKVPTWNVDASCKGAVAANKASNLADSQTVDACMKDEADARDELTKTWMSFAAPLRTRCEGEAGGNNLPSYVDLAVCLEIFSDPANKPTIKAASLKGAGKRNKPPAR